ncbi:MAG: zinc-ribbon domain-containing protein [Clostridia bacterium]|nr:zinc-ribbon domain-containing protein [Clostridia bacterium]MBR6512936.1 zinc-ribbon domain-containing protein [Clostridia bacterium]
MHLSADKIQEFGNTEAITCPKCGKSVYMNLLKATNGIGVFNVSLVNINTDLFAICPECQSLFSVNKDISKRATKSKSNNFTMVNEKNITFIRELK